MVIKCEKCGAMYILSDEKLKSQDWKFKCSKCQHETQIKPGEQKPTEGAQPAEQARAEAESTIPSEALPPDIQKYLDQFKADPKTKSFMPVAEYFFKEGKFERALEILEHALKYNPGYLSAHVLKGRTLFALNRFEEAVTELENVCNQSKENTLARKVLAKAYESLGKYDEAENALEIVLMLDASDKEAKDMLSQLKSRRSDLQPQIEQPVMEEKPFSESFEPPEGVTQAEGEKEEVAESPAESIEQGLDDIFKAPEGESEAEQVEPAGQEETINQTIKEGFAEEKGGEELSPEEHADLFSESETVGEMEEKVELPEEMATFPADKEDLFEEKAPEKQSEEFKEEDNLTQDVEIKEELKEKPEIEKSESIFEEKVESSPEIKKTEEPEAETKVEGFDSGRFDEGVTEEGVIEDVFKEEEEDAGISVETEIKEEPVAEETLPQIDEEVLSAQRPKVTVQEAKPVALTVSALKKEKKTVKIKPIFVVIPLVLLLIGGGAGYYYWTFQHIEPATASVDKLITVSKGIFKAGEKSRLDAERFWTEAVSEYDRDSIKGLMNSYELLKKAIASDAHNARYFGLLAEVLAELGLNQGDKKYFDDSYRIASRSQEMSPQSADSLRAIAHYYQATGKHQEAIEYLKKALSAKQDDVYSLVMLADEFLENPDKLQEAEELVKKSIGLKETPRSYYTLGKVYQKMGRTNEAIDSFNKAIRLQWHVKSVVALAELYNNTGSQNEVDKIFESFSSKINELHPNEQKILLLTKASIDFENGKLPEARRSLEQVLKLSPQEVNAYKLLGLIATKQNNLDEATGYYEKVLAIDPRNADVNYLCGTIYLQLHKYTQAINKFKISIEVNPDDYRFYNGLGNAFVLNGQIDDGINELKKALELSKNDVEVLYNLVDAYVQKNLIDDALALAQKAVSADPYSVSARLALSMVYIKLNKKNEAKTELEKAINLKPDDGKPYKLMAEILLNDGEVENAERYAEKAVKLSSDAESYSIYSNIMLRQNKYDEAVTSIKKAIALQPYNFKHYYDLGEIYLKNKQYDNSLKAFQDAVNYNPQDVYSNYMIGNVLELLGKNDDAYSQYEKIVTKIDRNFAPAHFRMGLIAEKKGDISKAISRFQTAVDLDSTKAEYLYYLGKTQYASNDVVKAKENLEKASNLDRGNSSIHLYLGMAYDYLGETDKALNEYNQSFKINPSNTEPLVRSANIYRSQGDYDKSMELLSRALKLEPGRETIYYALGLLYEEKSELEKAISNYKKAMSLNEKYPDPYYSLGFIYFKLGKNAEAKENFKKSLSLGIDPERAKKVKETLSRIP
jgi:predicted Zn finger-like uncharacterized protein